jgi:DnaJ like chaperone protein
MVRLKKSWIGIVGGFIIGAILSQYSDDAQDPVSVFILGAAFAIFGLLIYSMVQVTISSFLSRDFGFLKGEEKFLSTILILAAEVVKADGKIDDVELDLVKKRLEAEFNTEDTTLYFQRFQGYLEVKHSLSKLGKVIDYEFDEGAKTHLIYLLVSLATADGLLTNAELNIIQKIARAGNIRPAILMRTVKMFEFRREQSYRQKSQQSSGHRKSTLSASTLRKAYALIGVPADATMDEVKKAYRKLAKIHHPDKVAHLGDMHQNTAKEKFQLIVDAYDLIKEKRGL